jgi:type I restriction enzyme S subunit
VKISLPPIAEQKRIVDLISSVDSYIEALQQQVDKAKKSRNAVLHEFLARDWEGSVETTLGEVATWGSGGTPKADNSKFYGGNIPWCVIGDLNEGDVFDTEKKITDLGLKNSSAKKIEPGHVLIAMYGASIGKTGIAAIEMATNQAIAFAKVHENLVTNKYLLIYLQSQKNKFVEAGQGAAQPNISQTVLKSWRFSLPPIGVQHGLVKVISSFDNQIQGLEKTNSKTKDLRSALLSDLLSGNHEIPKTYDKLIGAA